MKTQIEIIKSKIFPIESFHYQLEVWRFLNEKIVFTNGCFDIIHLGHVEYLAKASDLGTILVVGMNTDLSVKRLKGESRPIYEQDARAMTMAAFRFVDAVVLFDEDTPYELIKLVERDVLVKGSDYGESDIVGTDIVKARGGEVVTVDLVPGYSTSGAIDKI